MKRILLGFSLLLSLTLSAQSWQSKPVVRIEDAGQSFLYTFSDSSDAYINKCNVSYIVNLPNSQWVQLGYMYDGSTSRIITASYSIITQPDLGSAKILSDTLNAWLRDCASTGGGGGSGVQSVVAGTNISVDNTDPENPIVNATGDTLYYAYRYGQIDTLMDAGGLITGALYKITDRGDRGLFFHAISTSELSNTGIRLMLCPSWYGIGTNYSNNWIGVWNVLQTDGDVNAGDLAIRGGLVWENQTGAIGTAPDDFSLDGVNWTVIPKASFSDSEYTEKQFDIIYDFDNDWIQWQMDGFSNGVGFPADLIGYQPVDVTDWNQTLNPITGINMFGNHNLLEGCFNNWGTGEIANNLCKVIKGNHLQGSVGISANKSNRIEYNENTGNIIYNTVFAVIGLPSTVTDVEHNATTAGSYVDVGIDGSQYPFTTRTGAINQLQFNGSYTTDNTKKKLVAVDTMTHETYYVDVDSLSVTASNIANSDLTSDTDHVWNVNQHSQMVGNIGSFFIYDENAFPAENTARIYLEASNFTDEYGDCIYISGNGNLSNPSSKASSITCFSFSSRLCK